MERTASVWGRGGGGEDTIEGWGLEGGNAGGVGMHQVLTGFGLGDV